MVATNHRHMPVAAEAVWDVLADPFQYAHWVVGSKDVRDADPGFPAPGTRFHHSIGIGPLTVRDHTEVVESARPRLMHLRAKARPLGTATVVMEITATPEGALVSMSERPDGLYSPMALNPLVHVAAKLRNAESLRRLEALVLR
jgi:carbon monoxide dehydrogenase subunit G